MAHGQNIVDAFAYFVPKGRVHTSRTILVVTELEFRFRVAKKALVVRCTTIGAKACFLTVQVDGLNDCGSCIDSEVVVASSGSKWW